MASNSLTHFDDQGRAQMVDVGSKAETDREAIAVGYLHLQPNTLDTIRQGTAAKGDVLAVARLAGIMGAKRTGELIPLCHPLPLTHVGVDFAFDTDTPERPVLWIRATARTVGRTGVEMEALTAVQTAALTVYDMCKAIDRAMVLGGAWLWRKRGGRSGLFEHPQTADLGPPAELIWR
ncbi:MAG: cyclic pyranopterin monophosphate synthase MoaC [Myxococcota bacterium]